MNMMIITYFCEETKTDTFIRTQSFWMKEYPWKKNKAVGGNTRESKSLALQVILQTSTTTNVDDTLDDDDAPLMQIDNNENS